MCMIAHVDHGKTTLVDSMLRQSGAFRSNQEVKRFGNSLAIMVSTSSSVTGQYRLVSVVWTVMHKKESAESPFWPRMLQLCTKM
jgi:translation elongation factor EF-4